MIPPICCICHERFNPSSEISGLIYFKEDDEDRKLYERIDKEHIVAHPSNAYWFCEKHFHLGLKNKEFTKTEAFQKINEELK